MRQLICITIIGLSVCLGCQALPIVERNPANQDLTDVNYVFEQSKVDAAANAFHFMRSFVDYYYLLMAKNPDRLSTVASFKNFGGWCAGDAHAENFGFLIQKDGRFVFTINDMDDAGPCPVAYDFFRLMSSSQVFSPDVKIHKILAAYIAGIGGDTYPVPATISAMKNDAESKGLNLNPKKVAGQTLNRDKNSEELDQNTLQGLQRVVDGLLPGGKLLDAYKTAKVGGGSGGMIRYEALIKTANQLVDIEFKEQTTPSIYPVATAPIPNAPNRIAKTLQVEQGSQFLPYYGYVKIHNLDMLARPIIWGNTGMNLGKNSTSDDLEAIYFEAYILGILHRKSVDNPDQYLKLLMASDIEGWKQDSTAMAHFIDKKYKHLSP